MVNFAHGAMGMYLAYAFFAFRETGDLVLPVIGWSGRIHLLARPTLASALVFLLILSTIVGLAIYGLVFRPLRDAPALARVVASLGLLLYLQETVRLQFPTAGAGVSVRRPVLPERSLHWGTLHVTENRLILAVLALAVAALLAAVFRWTRFGLATRAAAANEKGALLTGISPDRVGAGCWAIATILAGFAVVLIEPIASLDPAVTTLLVIPALAAALLGGLESFVATAAAGLGIAMVQQLIAGWLARPGTHLPHWLPGTGLQTAVPVIAILVILLIRGDALPDRSTIAGQPLPAAPRPRHVELWALGLSLIVTAITAPQGLTGLWREQLARARRRPPAPVAEVAS